MMCEQSLANIVHVPIKPDDLTRRAEYVHPAYLPSSAQQWRFLLYIDEPLEKMSMKYEMCGRMHSAQILEGYTKVFYVFGSSSKEVSEFCVSEKMTIWLFKNKKQVAKGVCFPFKDFHCRIDCLTQEMRVTLATANAHTYKVHLYAGISMDHTLNPKALAINIEKYRSVFIPDESFFTSDAFPPTWMELFTKDYKELAESDYLDSPE